MAGPNVQLVQWLKPSWLAKVAVVPHPTLSTPCWVWLGGNVPQGYGRLRIGGKMRYLHRYSWEQANGEELGPDRDGHHLCYNRPCFNHAHIEAQSKIENRGPTWFRSPWSEEPWDTVLDDGACPLSRLELLALYDLNAYFAQVAGML